MHHHVADQQAIVRELAPLVARHLVQQRAFSVHDLVMRERQDEMLREGVYERERDQMMVMAPVDRIERHVAQRVVHPPHVPLEVKAEPAQVNGAADTGVRRRFLGHHEHALKVVADRPVELLQELDRFDVLAPAILIRGPLAGFARVVEIKHRGHRIHAQTVDVIHLEPKERVRDQEIANFVATVVEDLRAPFHVLASARVGMLIQVRTVELREAVRVAREMRWNPVHEHANARLMEAIHEPHEIVRRSVSSGRREVPEHLIAPRPIERMLGDTDDLDVRIAEVEHVRN